jgi:hypothetical protein
VLRGASIIAAVTLAAGCTTSLLRYKSVHVGNGALRQGQGTQIYGVDDALGVARAVAPPSVAERSPDDAVFEIRSWKVETAAVTQRVSTVRVRDAGAPDGGTLVSTISSESCSGAPPTFESEVIRKRLEDAGHPPGYDVTVALVADEDTEATDAFMRAASDPTSPVGVSDLRVAVETWRATLLSDQSDLDLPWTARTNDERAMAAAYNLALAHQLGDAPEDAEIFASIAILRAPTHALQLDVLRLLSSVPAGVNKRTWNVKLADRAIAVPCTKTGEDIVATGGPAEVRRTLARLVARFQLERPREAAAALEHAARMTVRPSADAPVSAAARTFYRAAATLYARDWCLGAQVPTSARGELRCRAAAALLIDAKGCP